MAYTLLQRLAVTFYMVLFMSGIWAWFLVPFMFWSPLMIPYSIYLWYAWFGPGSADATDVKWPQPLKRMAVWRYAAAFYPAKIIKTAELDPEGNYIFAAHPHGIFCSSLFLAFATEGMDFSKMFPGIDPHFLTLVLHMKLPIIREIIMMHGMLDCSRETCKRVLTGGSGRSIALAVGGAIESLHVVPGSMDIIVKRRQGFVRLACETGAAIVPVISFGENDLFTSEIVPPDSAFGRFQKWGLRNTGITSPKFSWAGPHQVPINMVFGAPIKVPKYEGDIFSEEGKKVVHQYHTQYLEQLRKLYDEHKNTYHAGRTSEMKFIG